MKKITQELLEFGIINIDKPSGPTSFKVSEYVKNLLGLRKTAHFGTLDPKVTGVLPVALNRACKLTGFFLGHDKEYIGVMRFHEEIDKKKVEKAIKEKFTGVITQLPPVKSRVKRAERQREIKSFEILEVNGQDFVFKAVVQGGTYIRKLVHDLGETLGVGAHMLELRRTKAGIFSEDDKNYSPVNLYDFEKAIEDEKLLKKIIIPGEKAIKKVFPIIEIKKEPVDRILHGQPIYHKDLKKPVKIDQKEIVAVFLGKQFIGMFKVIDNKYIFAKSEFTFQEIK